MVRDNAGWSIIGTIFTTYITSVGIMAYGVPASGFEAAIVWGAVYWLLRALKEAQIGGIFFNYFDLPTEIYKLFAIIDGYEDSLGLYFIGHLVFGVGAMIAAAYTNSDPALYPLPEPTAVDVVTASNAVSWSHILWFFVIIFMRSYMVQSKINTPLAYGVVGAILRALFHQFGTFGFGYDWQVDSVILLAYSIQDGNAWNFVATNALGRAGTFWGIVTGIYIVTPYIVLLARAIYAWVNGTGPVAMMSSSSTGGEYDPLTTNASAGKSDAPAGREGKKGKKGVAMP